MSDINRRDALKIGAGAAALGALGPQLVTPAQAADWTVKPEANASIRVLRWKRFVQGDEDKWMENTAKYTQATGVKVRVDHEGWEDMNPKAGVAASVGAGPDIIVGWMDTPHLYVDKLVDLTALANYLGGKYGGWYDAPKKYATNKGKWIGLPLGAGGALLNWRVSWVKEAGFDKIPTDTAGFLKLCQALNKNGHPPGFALSHATGDSETWMHCLLWGFGGKLVDDKNNVVINSPETIEALEYVKELSQTFIPGCLSWSGVSNNNAFLEGKISLTSNGISIYYVSKNEKDAAKAAIAGDMDHAQMPIGKIGKPTEMHLLTQAFVFKYSKFPKAAQDYLRFMWEKEQYEPWQAASLGYLSHPLKAYGDTALWKSDPKLVPYRDCCARMLWNGYSGDLGYSSAAALADWIVVDMFASVAAGQKSAKDAAAEAAKRAERVYKA